MLTLQNTHTYIEQFHILQGINLNVKKGEIVVLLGRNGAGKSTTIRTIMGITPPSKGRIEFLDETISSLSPHIISRKGIGYVPEDHIIFNNLTVKENLLVAFRGKQHLINNKLNFIFDLFPDLSKALHKKGGNLSGGQKQMLAISRALLNDNKLILVDEPSKGLAPVIIDKIVTILKELKEHTSILLVEQNFSFASRVADRYYLIDDGVTVQDGKIEELENDNYALERYLGISSKEGT